MSGQLTALQHNSTPLRQAVSRAAQPLCVRSPCKSSHRITERRRDRTQCSAAKETKGETRREALGSIVIETDEDLPEPPAEDFWEGGAWDWFGKLAIVFVPILIAAALGTGLFAAATYNSGADKILQPALEDKPAQIIDAPQ